MALLAWVTLTLTTARIECPNRDPSCIVRSVWPADEADRAIALIYHTPKCPNGESTGKADARNRDGAVGLFQLVGKQRLASTLGFPWSQMTDPYVNTIVAYIVRRLEGWHAWQCAPAAWSNPPRVEFTTTPPARARPVHRRVF
jgi:hypothetical protein